jgi:hypothetical protein
MWGQAMDRRQLDLRAKEIVDVWNERRAVGADVWMYPTIAAALAAGCPWLHVVCTICQQQNAVDLRGFKRHQTASISGVMSEIACAHCQRPGDVRPVRLSPTCSSEPTESPSADEVAQTRSEPPFFFLCPVTGTRVKGVVVVEPPSDDPNSFEPVRCLACGRIHLLNFKTRKTIGEDRAGSNDGTKRTSH